MDAIVLIEELLAANPGEFLVLTDEQIDALSLEDIEALQSVHGERLLLQLPPREQKFFAWLKEHDPDIWADLWDDDEELLVALSFLAHLQAGKRGFLICELENNPNYFFTKKLLTPDGLEKIPRILALAERGHELSPGEALLFELMVAPIDIWRFCYKYGLPVQFAKEMVHELYRDNILVHLTERDDLLRYIDDE